MNFTCTSSATIEVSDHSCSPMRNVKRLMGKAPVAVVVAPLCARVTGTTTSLLTPLMLSLPATSNLLASMRLMLLDWKVALGNAATLNHTALGSSALASRPMSTLPVSTVKAILLVASLAGSKATWALKVLNLPSTGTPICLLTNWISLWAGTSACCAMRMQEGSTAGQGQKQRASSGKSMRTIEVTRPAAGSSSDSGTGGRDAAQACSIHAQTPCVATSRRGPQSGASGRRPHARRPAPPGCSAAYCARA